MKVLHSICQQIWKTQQWPQDWKRSVFTPIPKKGNAKECSNYHTIAFISHASKIMLKILQARLQQYVRDWVNPGCGGRDSDGFGWGSVPVVLPGSPLQLGTRRERGRGGANPGGAGRGRLTGGMGRGSQLRSRGLQLRLGTPISSAPGSPRIAIPWVQRRAADHR